MPSLKNHFLSTLVFLGTFVSNHAHAENNIALSLESRLQHLGVEERKGERLQELFDLYWDWRMEDNPEEASYLGYPGNHGRWTDLSEGAIESRKKAINQFLKTLISIDTANLSEKEAISYDILKRTFEEELAGLEFGDQYLLVNQMHGLHLHVPLIIGFMPHQTIKDYENILARLNLLPELFQQTIQLLSKGIELGITPPQAAVLSLPEQILNQITDHPLDSPLLQAFRKFPSSIDSESQARLMLEAVNTYREKVIPAFVQFHTYMIESYLPNCRKTIGFSDLPRGKEWYAHHVKCSTTTQLTPEEIHQIGLKEVERIHKEMMEIIQSVGFNGSFEKFLHFMKTDPQFFYSNREDLLKGYQMLTRDIESKLPALFSHLPSLPFEVVPIPSYSEESQIAAYYCSGSFANNRPGHFFINTSYPEQRPKWEMEPLALHEAVPGHHLQITLAQELQGIPEFRKNVHFTAYIEGWGLYAESLGSELNLYRDPYSVFGRLSYEMLRAIRLVVDTGMHAMGWSREQAIQFFKEHVGMSDHEITTEVDRYLVIPGQALAYKIGELKIKEMRRLSTQQLGNNFDIRDFHSIWLRHGTLPLDIAEKNIREWIQHSLIN